MRRVTRLLEEGENPARILVVTFTRTAAADLKRQLEEVGAPGADLVVASTLHRLCFHILLKQHVLQATQRVPRTLFDFETDYLLADLGPQFGGKRERERRLNAYEAAWARLQHDEIGFGCRPRVRGIARALAPVPRSNARWRARADYAAVFQGNTGNTGKVCIRPCLG